MGVFDFIKDAGEKIFKPGEAKREAVIKDHLGSYGADYANVDVEVDGNTATLTGSVGSQAAREKAVLIAGNIDGIEKVDDRLTVTASSSAPDFSNVSGGVATTEASTAPGVVSTHGHASQGGETASTFYTVQKGDTLSKIAKEHYGNANKYQQIFEANEPMLKHPDKIYPGQVLRIPADA